MINPKLIKVQQDEENITSVGKPHQLEDSAMKTTAQFFSKELLPYFNIIGEVDHIGPTEIVHHPITEFTEGFNTYRVQPIIMKGYRVEKVFDNINYKLEHAIPLTKEDLVPLTLCPLMSGELSQKDRIHQALQIVQKSEDYIEDSRKIEAVIYAMANKFLNETELNQIKEEIKMTKLGTLLYNDGKTDEALENAKNFFINGVSFDIVSKSIKNISDEKLREIYDEVMASKNE